MDIRLIYAVGTNGAFGLMNDLPWRLPSELKLFSETTMGHAVLMGRNTWDSLPAAFRPLKGRLNMILSQTMAHPKGEGGWEVVSSLADAIQTATEAGYKTLFIIGGALLIEKYQRFATSAHVSEVEYDGDFDIEGPELIDYNGKVRVPMAPVDPANPPKRQDSHLYTHYILRNSNITPLAELPGYSHIKLNIPAGAVEAWVGGLACQAYKDATGNGDHHWVRMHESERQVWHRVVGFIMQSVKNNQVVIRNPE